MAKNKSTSKILISKSKKNPPEIEILPELPELVQVKPRIESPNWSWFILLLLLVIAVLSVIFMFGFYQNKNQVPITAITKDNATGFNSVLNIVYQKDSIENILVLKNLSEVRSVCQCVNCLGCTNYYSIRGN